MDETSSLLRKRVPPGRPERGFSAYFDRPEPKWCPEKCRLQFSSVLVTVQILVFLSCWISSLVLFRSDLTAYYQVSPCLLYTAGARYAPSIRYEYRFDRLFLPIFLHNDWIHLVINVVTTLQVLSLFRSPNDVVSVWRLMLYYFLCGSGANAFACLLSPYYISVGSSGAFFGLLALWLVFVVSRWNELDAAWRNWQIVSLILLAILCILSAAFLPNVDNWAHMGGFLLGLVGGYGFLNTKGKYNYDLEMYVSPGSSQITWGRFISLFLFFVLYVLLIVGIFVMDIANKVINC